MCVFLSFLVLLLTSSVVHNLIEHFATVNVYLTEYSIFMSHLRMNGRTLCFLRSEGFKLMFTMDK